MQIPAILQQLGRSQSNPMMNQIKQTIQMVKASQNPQAMLNQLIINNPSYKQAMDIVNQYGGDVNKALNETVSQMGIDPKEIMSLFN